MEKDIYHDKYEKAWISCLLCSVEGCDRTAYTVFQGNALCKEHYNDILNIIAKEREKQKKIAEFISKLNEEVDKDGKGNN